MSTDSVSAGLAADRVTTRKSSLRRLPLEAWLYGSVLVLALLNIWSLPLLPAQDSPLHSYYSQVFAKLLAGNDLYASEYHIRSLFPPYSAHLYLLVILNQLIRNQFVTEEIIAVLLLICTFVGFARLHRSVNRATWVPVGVCLPFLAPWCMFMGFSNFTFGLAIAMFAYGYWLDHATESFGLKEATVSALLTFLLAAMHPIALALFFLAAGLYLAFQWLELRRSAPRTSLITLLIRLKYPTLFLVSAALVTYLWISHYVEKQALQWPLPTVPEFAIRVASVLTLNEISPFTATVWYTLPLMCVFLPCLWFGYLGIRARWRDPKILALAASAIASFLIYMVAPKEFNTGYHFYHRFSIFSIDLFLVLAGTWVGSRRTWMRMAVLSTVAGLATIAAQHVQSELALQRDRPALLAEALPAGSHVVQLRFGDYPSRKPLRYTPAMWVSAYWCSRSHAILMNMPWAQQPYFPIQSNGVPDTIPLDLAQLYLKAIREHAALPLQPDGIVIEMAADHLQDQDSAIQAFKQDYGFDALPGANRNLMLLVRKHRRS